MVTQLSAWSWECLLLRVPFAIVTSLIQITVYLWFRPQMASWLVSQLLACFNLGCIRMYFYFPLPCQCKGWGEAVLLPRRSPHSFFPGSSLCLRESKLLQLVVKCSLLSMLCQNISPVQHVEDLTHNCNISQLYSLLPPNSSPLNYRGSNIPLAISRLCHLVYLNN